MASETAVVERAQAELERMPTVHVQVMMTAVEARRQVEALHEIHRSVLTENVDYGKVPGTERPALYKSGAELLLKVHRLGHRFSVVELERDQDGHKEGVTYRCHVTAALPDGQIVEVATCDGYCGYDESKYFQSRAELEAKERAWAEKDKRAVKPEKFAADYRAPWNTLVKMSQKRALVGASVQATAASGIFTQDVDDYAGTPDSPTPQGRQAPRQGRQAEQAPPEGQEPSRAFDPKAAGWESEEAAQEAHKAAWARATKLPQNRRSTVRYMRENYGWPMSKAHLDEFIGACEEAERQEGMQAEDRAQREVQPTEEPREPANPTERAVAARQQDEHRQAVSSNAEVREFEAQAPVPEAEAEANDDGKAELLQTYRQLCEQVEMTPDQEAALLDFEFGEADVASVDQLDPEALVALVRTVGLIKSGTIAWRDEQWVEPF